MKLTMELYQAMRKLTSESLIPKISGKKSSATDAIDIDLITLLHFFDTRYFGYFYLESLLYSKTFGLSVYDFVPATLKLLMFAFNFRYVLMCIHFLQHRRPAILPCLQVCVPTS